MKKAFTTLIWTWVVTYVLGMLWLIIKPESYGNMMARYMEPIMDKAMTKFNDI